MFYPGDAAVGGFAVIAVLVAVWLLPEVLCGPIVVIALALQFVGILGPYGIGILSAWLRVAVLDVMLGRGDDGYALCREIRSRRWPVAILMLTARDLVPDRVRGLEAGADDYLAKPFAFAELVARLRAVTRRHGAELAGTLGLGALTVDPRGHTAQVAATPLTLSRREFDLLVMLLRNRDAILSRDQIHEEVWGFDPDIGSNIVEVYIAKLRRKLAGSGAVITTARGLGYRVEEAPAR